MNNDYFIKQTSSIIEEFNLLKKSAIYDDLSDQDAELLTKLITKSKALVARIVSTKSEYYKDITLTLEKKYLNLGNQLNHIIGSVTALQEDLQNDFLKSYTELLHSEIFSDYIEIAKHLYENGYKDSAAVIVGSTLESHLRTLCQKNGIEIEIQKNEKITYKTAERMNEDLGKNNVYSIPNQKQITAWLAVRNNSAHGKYEAYTPADVNFMLLGVENFIAMNPA